MIDILLVTIFISFSVGLIFAPRFIKFFRSAGIVGVDMHKKKRPEVPEMGAPIVMAGFLAGIFFFIWIKVFIWQDMQNLIELFAGISTVLIIMTIGIFDDLTVLLKRRVKGRFKKYKRIGLKQWQKPLLTLPAAIPLMAIMAGNSTMVFPFLGVVDIGILYPLLLVPIGVVGASNAISMLGGFNGLEAGLGTVLIGSLGVFAYLHGEIGAAFLAFAFSAALLAFLRYNWYPARIFPGDGLNYAIGAVIVTIAIIGNMEKFAIYAFLPWFLEFLLKAGSKFKAENFGVLQKDETLKAPYNQNYSLTHFAMRLGRLKEYQVTAVLILFEIIIVATLFYISTIPMWV